MKHITAIRLQIDTRKGGKRERLEYTLDAEESFPPAAPDEFFRKLRDIIRSVEELLEEENG